MFEDLNRDLQIHGTKFFSHSTVAVCGTFDKCLDVKREELRYEISVVFKKLVNEGFLV